ncbi:MAG: PilZ domain-containing protein [Candidatus Omnitrophota bacterium]
MAKIKKSERRYTKRLAYALKVKVYRVDKDATRLLEAYVLETRDVNLKGLFLKTPKVFPIGTEVILEIDISSEKKPLFAAGEIAWIAKPYQKKYYPGMGVCITEIKRGDGKKLKEFFKDKFRNYHHALELKNMYIQLKNMGGRLYELEELHPHAENFKKAIDNAIKEIDQIAHVIDREVWEVKSL